MKNKSVRGSLFTLLARNYLLFTLTLLAMAAVVFALWNAWLDSLYQPPDWDGLLKSPALSSGDYDALRRHLGRDGNDFAVYDGSGALIYATGSGFDAQCEPEELGLVQLWDSAEEINVYELTSRQIDAAAKKGKFITERLYQIENIEYVNLVSQNDEISG